MRGPTLFFLCVCMGCSRSEAPIDCTILGAIDAGGCERFLLRPDCLEPDEVAIRSVPVVVTRAGAPIFRTQECGGMQISGVRERGAVPHLELHVQLFDSADAGVSAFVATIVENPSDLPANKLSTRFCGYCTGAVTLTDAGWKSVEISRQSMREILGGALR